MNIIAYYLEKDKDLLQETYDRLPSCHKFQYNNFYNTVVRNVGSGFVNEKKEIKEHVDFVMKKIMNKIIDEILEKKSLNIIFYK